MLNKIARFEKVSFEQFKEDYLKIAESSAVDYANFVNSEDKLREIYDSIRIPKRESVISARYCFCSTLNVVLRHEKSIEIPTGICCHIEGNWLLQLIPFDNSGNKGRLQFANTLSIIDSSDYYSNCNKHIKIKLTNDNKNFRSMDINVGDVIAKGIFIPYGIAINDLVMNDEEWV